MTGPIKPPIGVAVESLGKVIGAISALPRDQFGLEHAEAVARAYATVDATVQGVLMNLLVYGNGHGAPLDEGEK